jgi:hypothetical protein
MPITQTLFDALQNTARDIGYHILRPLPQNAWNHYNGAPFQSNDPQSGRQGWFSFPREGVVRFSLGDEGFIEFGDIAPSSIGDSEFEPPVISDTTQIDSQISTIVNRSDAEVTREYNHSMAAERSLSETVGVGYSASVTQSFGYSIGLVKGKTSITVELSTSYERQWGNKKSETSQTRTSVAVPPRTTVRLITNKKVGDFTQRARVFTEVGYTITVEARNEWTHHFRSIENLVTIMTGFGLDRDPWSSWWKDNPTNAHRARSILSVEPMLLEFDIKGKSSTISDVTVESKAIEK